MGDATEEIETETQTEGVDLPAIELTEEQRRLRDAVVGAFPSCSASSFRGELTLDATPSDLVALLSFLKGDPDLAFELLSDVSALHWPGGTIESNDQETTGWPTYTEQREAGRIEVLYLLRSVSLGHLLRLRVTLPDDAAVVASATRVYSSANFMEREVYDLMGVEFTGHPGLTRIMMPDDWEGHPHRKDYPLGGVEVMYKGKTVPPPDERDY